MNKLNQTTIVRLYQWLHITVEIASISLSITALWKKTFRFRQFMTIDKLLLANQKEVLKI